MDEIPVLKKCCFCIPLRYGLLTWGYLKLVIALLVLIFFTLILISFSGFVEIRLMQIILPVLFLLITEIVLHIIFIVGAHKKNFKLLRLYYYYAMFMWFLTVAMAIGSTIFMVIAFERGGDDVLPDVIFTLNSCCFLLSILIQTFLLLSLRSEIIKLRSNCPYRFVKDVNDPEGTISVVNFEDASIGNGSEHIYEKNRS